MTGAWDITGSINAVRNDDIHDLSAKFIDSNTGNLAIGQASGFAVKCPKILINETSIDNGGAVLMQTIPFTAVADPDFSSGSTLLEIDIA